MRISMPVDLIGVPKASFSSRPVCGVLATAVAAKRPFMDAWKYYAKTKRGNWKGALQMYDILKGMKDLGAVVKKSPELTKFYKGRPIKYFVANNAIDDNKVYVVTVRQHIQVVQGLNVLDQTGLNNIAKYIHARRRVEEIYVVESYGNGTEELQFEEKEMRIMSEVETKVKNTKKIRALEIYKRESSAGKKRKDILAIMVTELETTWGSASTFYHLAKQEAEKSTAPVAAE